MRGGCCAAGCYARITGCCCCRCCCCRCCPAAATPAAAALPLPPLLLLLPPLPCRCCPAAAALPLPLLPCRCRCSCRCCPAAAAPAAAAPAAPAAAAVAAYPRRTGSCDRGRCEHPRARPAPAVVGAAAVVSNAAAVAAEQRLQRRRWSYRGSGSRRSGGGHRGGAVGHAWLCPFPPGLASTRGALVVVSASTAVLVQVALVEAVACWVADGSAVPTPARQQPSVGDRCRGERLGHPLGNGAPHAITDTPELAEHPNSTQGTGRVP